MEDPLLDSKGRGARLGQRTPLEIIEKFIVAGNFFGGDIFYRELKDCFIISNGVGIIFYKRYQKNHFFGGVIFCLWITIFALGVKIKV